MFDQLFINSRYLGQRLTYGRLKFAKTLGFLGRNYFIVPITSPKFSYSNAKTTMRPKWTLKDFRV